MEWQHKYQQTDQRRPRNKRRIVKKAAARRTKCAKPNDAADGYDNIPVEDSVENPVKNPVNADGGVIFNNKKKRVAGAGQTRKSIQPKKALVQSEALFIESTSESEEYVDKEEDNAEEEAHEEEHAEEDAVQDSSDCG